MLTVDTFADLSGEGPGEVGLTPKDKERKSIVYEVDVNVVEPREKYYEVPGPRSMASLHDITTGMGRQ